MKEKKIKVISVRISLTDYVTLKHWYKREKNRHKSFSDFIRYLIEIGFHEYY